MQLVACIDMHSQVHYANDNFDQNFWVDTVIIIIVNVGTIMDLPLSFFVFQFSLLTTQIVYFIEWCNGYLYITDMASWNTFR